MKYLFLLPLLALLSASPVQPPVAPAPARTARATETVYVCMNKGQVYHGLDDCAALVRCTHEVKTMSAETAQQMGRRQCLKCY